MKSQGEAGGGTTGSRHNSPSSGGHLRGCTAGSSRRPQPQPSDETPLPWALSGPREPGLSTRSPEAEPQPGTPPPGQTSPTEGGEVWKEEEKEWLWGRHRPGTSCFTANSLLPQKTGHAESAEKNHFLDASSTGGGTIGLESPDTADSARAAQVSGDRMAAKNPSPVSWHFKAHYFLLPWKTKEEKQRAGVRALLCARRTQVGPRRGCWSPDAGDRALGREGQGVGLPEQAGHGVPGRCFLSGPQCGQSAL